MKHRYWILTLILLLSLLLPACGAAAEPTAAPTEPPAPTEPAPTPAALYNEARRAIDSAAGLELTLSIQRTTTLGQDVYTLTSDQKLLLSGLGTDALTAQVEEALDCGGYTENLDEYYADGILRTTVYDTYFFQGVMGQEEYLSRFAPAVLLDGSLYGDISAATQTGETHLTFAAPTAAESWAMPADAELVSAEGTATISAGGKLAETAYTLTYRIGGIEITQTTTAKAKEAEPSITAPEGAFQEVEAVGAIRDYEIAGLYLAACPGATSTVTENFICQAADYVLSHQNAFSFTGDSSNHAAQLQHTYTEASLSTGQTTSMVQTERFADGGYTLLSDGQEQTNPEVTADDVLAAGQSLLTDNVLALDYFDNISAREAGGFLHLDIACNVDFAEGMVDYLNSSLYGDPAYLDSFSDGYTTAGTAAYLSIDLATGLPTAVGLSYSGTHSVVGQVFALGVQADQSFHLSDPDARRKITGETPEEPIPENPATPLFYRVTGEKGQQMWLMGTIHVGDSRTAHLPQAIYDALNASDALAVEFDTQAFEENLTSDPELMQQLAGCYYYLDGTTTKSLLEEELYLNAQAMLKASGNYNANAEVMKPYLWSQSITNFYVQQGYQLSAEKGVDNRLLTLAKEKGMEIRDIESGLSQMTMITSFSAPLQAQLLEDSLASTTASTTRDLNELYEAWCAGDEEALRQLLSEEFNDEGLTDAEIAELEPLIEEYNKAMSFDRNAYMLEVAQEYLESGDVVFYAVGLAHLLDETNGLVDALQAAGYTVELVA